jgi:hypothetical protein
MSVVKCRPATTLLLLERGASTEIADAGGTTPLLAACPERRWVSDDDSWSVFQELVRRSSAATRRDVSRYNVGSAVDWLAWSLQQDDEPASEEEKQRWDKRRGWAIAELLVSGVPVLPQHAPVVLPIAAALSARQQAELAERCSERRRWRGREAFVLLALDHQEMREAAQRVEGRRARLAELERAEVRRARVAELRRELRELEAEMESDAGDGSDDESDASDDESDGSDDESDGSESSDGGE